MLGGANPQCHCQSELQALQRLLRSNAGMGSGGNTKFGVQKITGEYLGDVGKGFTCPLTLEFLEATSHRNIAICL